MTALIVLAKVPRPGHSKTRLCPPCTLQEASLLAEAALDDTLDAVRLASVERRIVAIDGDPDKWSADGFEVIRQRGSSLDRRLAAVFADVGGRSLLIGMDTPQVTAALLNASVSALEDAQANAVVGPTPDGGYWAVGLERPDERVFGEVPMSSCETCAVQLARLRELELAVRLLPALEDVDDFRSATRVAQCAPGTEFASTLEKLFPSDRVRPTTVMVEGGGCRELMDKRRRSS